MIVNKDKRLKYQPELDFVLIALASSEDAYRLSWLINQALNIHLKRDDSVKIWDEKRENPGEFECYKHTKQADETVYRLVANRSENGFLEKKYRQFDYFLQIFDLPGNKTENILSLLNREQDIIIARLIESPGKALIQKLMI